MCLPTLCRRQGPSLHVDFFTGLTTNLQRSRHRLDLLVLNFIFLIIKICRSAFVNQVLVEKEGKHPRALSPEAHGFTRCGRPGILAPPFPGVQHIDEGESPRTQGIQ